MSRGTVMRHMKKRRSEISTSRAVGVYREMLSHRRIYCKDCEFFRMSDFWEFLAEDNTQTKIKTYLTCTEPEPETKNMRSPVYLHK